jgi:hypothetical protein
MVAQSSQHAIQLIQEFFPPSMIKSFLWGGLESSKIDELSLEPDIHKKIETKLKHCT